MGYRRTTIKKKKTEDLKMSLLRKLAKFLSTFRKERVASEKTSQKSMISKMGPKMYHCIAKSYHDISIKIFFGYSTNKEISDAWTTKYIILLGFKLWISLTIVHIQ